MSSNRVFTLKNKKFFDEDGKQLPPTTAFYLALGVITDS